jgi:hypothetical protein
MKENERFKNVFRVAMPLTEMLMKGTRAPIVLLMSGVSDKRTSCDGIREKL